MESVSLNEPKAMRISKAFLIITALVLCVMQAFIGIPMIGILNSIDLGNIDLKLIGILLAASFVTGLTALIFAIVGAVKEERPLTKVTVILKVCMIPFFIINIILWICVVLGMMNPFLLFGIPFAGLIGIVLTYVFLLMTSLPDAIASVIFMVKNKHQADPLLVLGIVLCFIFVVDVIGIILINRSVNRTLSKRKT